MRWNSHTPPPAKLGDLVFKRGFLFFPKKINGETRWLENAEWVEQCVLPRLVLQGESLRSSYLDWKPIRWADQPENKREFGVRPPPTPPAPMKAGDFTIPPHTFHIGESKTIRSEGCPAPNRNNRNPEAWAATMKFLHANRISLGLPPDFQIPDDLCDAIDKITKFQKTLMDNPHPRSPSCDDWVTLIKQQCPPLDDRCATHTQTDLSGLDPNPPPSPTPPHLLNTDKTRGLSMRISETMALEAKDTP